MVSLIFDDYNEKVIKYFRGVYSIVIVMEYF